MNSACPQIVRPAELLRGITFAADFTDRLSMIKDEWTLTNNPDVYNGVTLDGVNQCVSIKVTNPMTTYVSSMTWHMEFVPNFTPGTGTNYLWDTAGSRYLVYITAAGDLVVSLSGTVIFAVAWASYSAYWNASSRNVLTLTASSGDNDIYLNGNLLSNNAAAWTPGIATSLTLGARFCCTTGYTAIKILSFKMGAYLATLQEHIDIYNNQTWNYMNKADVILQMRHDDYDITNVRTLDSSGNANHAQLGDGSTPAKYPTQANGMMTFDGGDYLSLDGLFSLHTQTTGTIAFLARINEDPAAAEYFVSGRDGATTTRMYISTHTGNRLQTTWGGIAQNFNTLNLGRRWHTIAVTWTGGYFEVFLDGESLQNAVAYTTAAGTGDKYFKIGIDYTGAANQLHGYIADFVYTTEALTPTQLLDYHHRVMSTVARQV